MHTSTTAAFFLLTSMQTVLAQDQEVNLGRLTWSAFTCATYAEMSGDNEEQQRLFTIGYEAGKRFLAAIRDQSVPEVELQKTPWIVLMLAGGPSVEFALGRIYENAMQDAFDGVTKEDTAGMPITDPSQWITDDSAKSIIALNEYYKSNCELIR